jgi:hypothetical protein
MVFALSAVSVLSAGPPGTGYPCISAPGKSGQAGSRYYRDRGGKGRDGYL